MLRLLRRTCTVHLHRRENVQIFAAFWKHMSTAKHKKAGKPTAQEKQRKADMLGKAQHLLDAEKHGDDLLEKFHATTKRRRTAHRIEEVKTEDGEKSKAKGALASVTCSYTILGPPRFALGSRLRSLAHKE